ncbi:MAG TPA: phosphoglycerate mutase family protein [Pyrinomonadaceae bacterium]|nr:phosphoglycerate mutase family protein [Pyrinomonadaceae bacterium]
MNTSARARRLSARTLAALLLTLACAALLTHHAAADVDSNPRSQDGFKVTTVYLVRHAEKADAPPEDPPLSEAGRARAQELARVLGGAGVRAVYTSQFLRTKQTAEPLAKQLGLAPAALSIRMNPASPREPSAESIKEITDKIYERAGETTLVVGHSNTVPEVIRALGGDAVPKIDEKKFDDLFVLTVYGRGKAKVAQLKYGSAN